MQCVLILKDYIYVDMVGDFDNRKFTTEYCLYFFPKKDGCGVG